jgi:hypothetical protein
MSDILEVPPRRLEFVYDVCLHSVTATDTAKPPYCPRGHEPGADRVLDSGDRYADRELHQRFVALYDEKHTIDVAGGRR